MKVQIAGWGLATPLGSNAAQTWEALLAGQFITDHGNVPLPDNGRSRVTQLGLHVSREAIAAAGWSNSQLAEDRTALVVGTSKGPIVEWLSGSSLVTVQNQSYGIAQIATNLAGELRLGFGPRLTLSAACASGLHALIRATMLIQSGEAERALVVAVESSVHPLFLASFQRLGVLPKKGNRCRPFDQQRDGFLMSESAAAVCLEIANPTAGHTPPQIDRFALGGTGGHLTAGDPDGLLWRRLLENVIANAPPDLVHAHATGTVVNDPIELAAMESALENRSGDILPILYSHKGALGHSLGAAGLVAIVTNCLAHTHGTVPGNVGLLDPLPTTHLELSARSITRPIRRSVAAASGFGGPTAVVGLTTA